MTDTPAKPLTNVELMALAVAVDAIAQLGWPHSDIIYGHAHIERDPGSHADLAIAALAALTPAQRFAVDALLAPEPVVNEVTVVIGDLASVTWSSDRGDRAEADLSMDDPADAIDMLSWGQTFMAAACAEGNDPRSLSVVWTFKSGVVLTMDVSR